jgi:tetratricopeptide (TPR) repeat protein
LTALSVQRLRDEAPLAEELSDGLCDLMAQSEPQADADAMTPERACEALLKLGAFHHREGRLAQAELFYSTILRVRPDHADSLHFLGVLKYQLGHHPEAVELIAQALRLNPDRSDYILNLGNALQRSGRLTEAENCYRTSIKLAPDGAMALNNLGATLRDMGRPEEAEDSCRAALRLKPDYGDALNNLGTALADLGRFQESADSYRASLRLEPRRAEVRNNLGNVLTHLGELDDALAEYAAALELMPQSIEVHHNRAMTLLRAGRFEEGWAEYEWRWRSRQLAPVRRNFAQPQWDGEPLGDRLLLVHAEQGFGDTLQFCRYASRIAGRVVVEVQPELARLLQNLAGVEAVIPRGHPLPKFDVHCPMMSLPRLVEPTPDPANHAAAYLRAEPSQVEAWRARLAPLRGLRVGLVWAGGNRPDQPTLEAVNRRRSMTLAMLAPLAQVSGVSFVSLQKGAAALELEAAPEGMVVHDFTADLHDFADTAALAANLDLVISVDTAVAHLSAALGRPVWMANRFDCCWRWLMDRKASPWYPTLTQFCQAEPGDWDSVAIDLAAALQRAADLLEAQPVASVRAAA